MGGLPLGLVFPSPSIRRQQEHPCRGEDESRAPAPNAGGPGVRVSWAVCAPAQAPD